MNISVLSGADKNAGDFLIVQRSEELLKHIYPDAELIKYKRNESLEDQITKMNQSDVLVFAGGPAYVAHLYPDKIPLVKNLEDIKIPMFAMGLGWRGASGDAKEVYQYSFSPSTFQLLKRIKKDGYAMGCRDVFSVRALKSAGFSNGMMTGCPAWYNLKYIETDIIQNDGEIKKICISDPANIKNVKQFMDVVRYAKEKWPSADLSVVFHRGIEKDLYTNKKTADIYGQVCMKLEQLNVKYHDISYGHEGMSVYDDVNIHIGYRVHAHIYNLSRRNRSILIEEDGRGAGVNQTLGLRSICAYKENQILAQNRLVKYVSKRFINSVSCYTIQEIDDYIEHLEQVEFQEFKWAYTKMQFYYTQMEKHLRSIGEKMGEKI